MDSTSHLRHINVKTAAKEARQWRAALVQATDAATLARDFPRLSQDTHASRPIAALEWKAQFQNRSDTSAQPQAWLHLEAKAIVPLTCQRCLDEALISLEVDRWFRFEKDEDSAAAQDEWSEEDVLAMDQDLDVLELIEDELLMAIPMIPSHEQCPTEVKLQDQDSLGMDAEEKAHPFAVLSKLNRPAS
jgi:uncharacterized protein